MPYSNDRRQLTVFMFIYWVQIAWYIWGQIKKRFYVKNKRHLSATGLFNSFYHLKISLSSSLTRITFFLCYFKVTLQILSVMNTLTIDRIIRFRITIKNYIKKWKLRNLLPYCQMHSCANFFNENRIHYLLGQVDKYDISKFKFKNLHSIKSLQFISFA